jgi:hypothetical protein
LGRNAFSDKLLGAYDVLVSDEHGKIIARFNGMVYRKKQKWPE